MGVLLFLVFVVAAPGPFGSATALPDTVDFRYGPPRWFAPIGFLDDWQKSLVDEYGRLVYDFGPGPYARPGTSVQVSVKDEPLEVTTQRLFSPRVPVVVTAGQVGKTRVRQEAFALVRGAASPPPVAETAFRVRRRNGMVGAVAWACTDQPVDPAFRNVAWGTGREIQYEIDVEPGSRKRVALGFCDSYRKGRVKRMMDLHVEGAAVRTIDLLATGAQNEPQAFFFEAHDADAGGTLRITVAASPATQDPNVFVNGIWVFPPQADVTGDAVIRGAATPHAEVYVDAGQEPQLQQRGARVDGLRATFEGPSVTPVIEITSRRRFTFNTETGVLYAGEHPYLAARPSPVAARQTENGWVLELPEGTGEVEVIVIHGARLPEDIAHVPDLVAARERALQYWHRDVHLPWGRIQVPDAGIQAVLDASIRTMYQLRDVVDGLPQFQPGPSVYRGLWVGDGSWMTEAATLLGDTTAARQMIEAMVRHQRENGRVMVMSPPLLHRETAHLLWAICRHARLVDDPAWLEGQWTHVTRAVQWIRHLREEASRDPKAPYTGLLPPGLTDGGVGGINAEYGSTYWALIGLHAAAEAAQWLGKTETALRWQAEFEAFEGAFRRAAARDMRQDEFGHWYLPVRMQHDPDSDLPQRGQWGPLHATFPGRLFEPDDPLLRGTLAMLDARTVEGHVASLGWLTGGVWPIVEAHRALGYLWLGEAAKAQEILYAFVNHAAPVMVWIEEQMPQGEGTHTTGDVPHTMGNAQVIRLVRHLLVLERERTLELLVGVPAAWLAPGAGLSLYEVPTTFGALTLEVEVNEDGTGGIITMAPVGESGTPGGPVLNLKPLKQLGYVATGGHPLPERWQSAWGEAIRVSFEKTSP